MDKYMQEAISDFTFDAMAGGAIRHLSDLGYTPEEISEKLDIAVPLSKIEETIRAHRMKKESHTKIIRERDAYGRTTFRQVHEED